MKVNKLIQGSYEGPVQLRVVNLGNEWEGGFLQKAPVLLLCELGKYVLTTASLSLGAFSAAFSNRISALDGPHRGRHDY